MTIGTNARNDHIGNGATATYDYGFKIFSASDLRVTVRDLDNVETELGAPDDFTVTGVGNREGGTITLLAGNLASGYALTIRRVRPLTQTTDLRNQSGFFAEVHESALDHVVMLTQQLSDEISRSLRFPETDFSDGALPTPGDRANRFLAFDALGMPMASSGGAGVPVSVIMESVLGAASAAVARAFLGVNMLASIAELRTKSHNTYADATVLGYHTSGDSGGGIFRYDADDTTSVDDGGMTIVAADGARWKRVAEKLIDPRWFGAKGDGVFATDGVTAAGSTTFTSASGGFVASDVGKLIKIGGAGASAGTLITTIASVNSVGSVELTDAAALAVSGANYTYGSDDTAAIAAAKAYCLARLNSFRGGLVLAFTDGRYCFTDIGNLAISFFSVIARSAGVWLECFRTTSGPAVKLNGLEYDGSAGAYRVTFGGEYPINIRGNSNCSSILYYNNIHFSDVKANLRDGNVGILGDKAGNSGSPGAAVDTDFYIRLAHHDLDSFDAVPAVGWYMTETYACRIRAQIEVSGAPGSPGMYITTSNGNTFYGGTVESCNYGGVLVTSSSNRNTFIGMHNEFNGAGPDWQIDGHYNTLIGCAGAATYLTHSGAANIINGDHNQIIGGEFNDFEISSSADSTIVQGANLSTGTVGDNGSNSTFTACVGVTDKAPAPVLSAPTLGTGTIDTGNPYKPARYFRTRAGTVQIEGVVTMGTVSGETVILTLPEGFRPSERVVYTGWNLSTETAVPLILNTSGQLMTRVLIATGNVITLFSPPFRATG